MRTQENEHRDKENTGRKSLGNAQSGKFKSNLSLKNRVEKSFSTQGLDYYYFKPTNVGLVRRIIRVV